MNDGEDEKEEPVKKHARHGEGHMPGSSSTDPMPMQEQSPFPQKQVKRKHPLLVAQGTWTRIGRKSRRRSGGVERADSEKVTVGHGRPGEHQRLQGGESRGYFRLGSASENVLGRCVRHIRRTDGSRAGQGRVAEGKDERHRRPRQHGRLGDSRPIMTKEVCKN